MKREVHTIQHEVSISIEDLIRLLRHSGYVSYGLMVFTLGAVTVTKDLPLIAKWEEKKSLEAPPMEAKS